MNITWSVPAVIQQVNRIQHCLCSGLDSIPGLGTYAEMGPKKKKKKHKKNNPGWSYCHDGNLDLRWVGHFYEMSVS